MNDYEKITLNNKEYLCETDSKLIYTFTHDQIEYVYTPYQRENTEVITVKQLTNKCKLRIQSVLRCRSIKGEPILVILTLDPRKVIHIFCYHVATKQIVSVNKKKPLKNKISTASITLDPFNVSFLVQEASEIESCYGLVIGTEAGDIDFILLSINTTKFEASVIDTDSISEKNKLRLGYVTSIHIIPPDKDGGRMGHGDPLILLGYSKGGILINRYRANIYASNAERLRPPINLSEFVEFPKYPISQLSGARFYNSLEMVIAFGQEKPRNDPKHRYATGYIKLVSAQGDSSRHQRKVITSPSDATIVDINLLLSTAKTSELDPILQLSNIFLHENEFELEIWEVAPQNIYKTLTMTLDKKTCFSVLPGRNLRSDNLLHYFEQTPQKLVKTILTYREDPHPLNIFKRKLNEATDRRFKKVALALAKTDTDESKHNLPLQHTDTISTSSPQPTELKHISAGQTPSHDQQTDEFIKETSLETISTEYESNTDNESKSTVRELPFKTIQECVHLLKTNKPFTENTEESKEPFNQYTPESSSSEGIIRWDRKKKELFWNSTDNVLIEYPEEKKPDTTSDLVQKFIHEVITSPAEGSSRQSYINYAESYGSRMGSTSTNLIKYRSQVNEEENKQSKGIIETVDSSATSVTEDIPDRITAMDDVAMSELASSSTENRINTDEKTNLVTEETKPQKEIVESSATNVVEGPTAMDYLETIEDRNERDDNSSLVTEETKPPIIEVIESSATSPAKDSLDQSLQVDSSMVEETSLNQSEVDEKSNLTTEQNKPSSDTAEVVEPSTTNLTEDHSDRLPINYTETDNSMTEDTCLNLTKDGNEINEDSKSVTDENKSIKEVVDEPSAPSPVEDISNQPKIESTETDSVMMEETSINLTKDKNEEDSNLVAEDNKPSKEAVEMVESPSTIPAEEISNLMDHVEVNSAMIEETSINVKEDIDEVDEYSHLFADDDLSEEDIEVTESSVTSPVDNISKQSDMDLDETDSSMMQKVSTNLTEENETDENVELVTEENKPLEESTNIVRESTESAATIPEEDNSKEPIVDNMETSSSVLEESSSSLMEENEVSDLVTEENKSPNETSETVQESVRATGNEGNSNQTTIDNAEAPGSETEEVSVNLTEAADENKPSDIAQEFTDSTKTHSVEDNSNQTKLDNTEPATTEESNVMDEKSDLIDKEKKQSEETANLVQEFIDLATTSLADDSFNQPTADYTETLLEEPSSILTEETDAMDENSNAFTELAEITNESINIPGLSNSNALQETSLETSSVQSVYETDNSIREDLSTLVEPPLSPKEPIDNQSTQFENEPLDSNLEYSNEQYAQSSSLVENDNDVAIELSDSDSNEEMIQEEHEPSDVNPSTNEEIISYDVENSPDKENISEHESLNVSLDQNMNGNGRRDNMSDSYLENGQNGHIESYTMEFGYNSNATSYNSDMVINFGYDLNGVQDINSNNGVHESYDEEEVYESNEEEEVYESNDEVEVYESNDEEEVYESNDEEEEVYESNDEEEEVYEISDEEVSESYELNENNDTMSVDDDAVYDNIQEYESDGMSVDDEEVNDNSQEGYEDSNEMYDMPEETSLVSDKDQSLEQQSDMIDSRDDRSELSSQNSYIRYASTTNSRESTFTVENDIAASERNFCDLLHRITGCNDINSFMEQPLISKEKLYELGTSCWYSPDPRMKLILIRYCYKHDLGSNIVPLCFVLKQSEDNLSDEEKKEYKNIYKKYMFKFPMYYKDINVFTEEGCRQMLLEEMYYYRDSNTNWYKR